MRRLPHLALLAAFTLATALPAHAQFGRLIDRARDAVRAPAETVRSAATAAGVPAGTSSSTLDYSRFLGMRFFPLRGEFLFGTPADHLVFPPEGLGDDTGGLGEYQVRTAGGRIVARQEISLHQTGSAAFKKVVIRSGPPGDGPLQNGAYTLDFVFQGRLASRIPFTVQVTDNGDPFDPKTIYWREGPWRTLAFLEHETDRRDANLTFNAWVDIRELGTERGRVQFVLSRNGTPVASCKTSLCPVSKNNMDWESIEGYLVTYATRDVTNATRFTIADMTPGAYTMTVSKDDRVLQTYAFTGGAGTVVPHPRSAIDYDPRYDFLTPRRMKGQNLSNSYSLYWMEAAR